MTAPRAPSPPPDIATDAQLIDELESRVIELEMKAAYAEDLLDALNLTVARQQERIDLLLNELQQLREQAGQAGQQPAFRSLRDDLPPHY